MVLGLFQRKAAAVTAILAGVAHRLIINCTLKKLKAGNGFQMAMRGGGQPEERCQGENDVSKMPHVSIDTDRRANVQSNLQVTLITYTAFTQNLRTTGYVLVSMHLANLG